MEEIDLCWRLKNACYRIVYTPQSKVYHLGGGTLNKTSARKTFLNFRNNLLLIYKNLPKNELKSVLRKRRFLDFVAAIVFLLQAKPKEAIAVRKAYKAFNEMKKYYQSSGESVHSYPDCVYHRSIVVDAKLKGKKRFEDLKDSDFEK
jgi:GT2 family glycosyltransferase